MSPPLRVTGWCARSRDSCWRAVLAIGLIEPPSYIQAEMSRLEARVRRRLGVSVLAVPAQRPGERWSDQLRGAEAVGHEFPGRLELQGLAQQPVEMVPRDTMITQGLYERVVLLASALGPQHVGEGPFPAVAGRKPGSAPARAGAR